jgi:hypothetical protein
MVIEFLLPVSLQRRGLGIREHHAIRVIIRYWSALKPS